MQRDVAGLVPGQQDAAAALDDGKRLFAQRKFPGVEQLGLGQHQIGQEDAGLEALDGETDMVNEGNGGLIAQLHTGVPGLTDDLLRSAHHIGTHILQHFQKLGLHFGLHIVDFLNAAFIDLAAGAFGKADPVAQQDRLASVRGDGRHGVVIEYLDGSHTYTNLQATKKARIPKESE